MKCGSCASPKKTFCKMLTSDMVMEINKDRFISDAIDIRAMKNSEKNSSQETKLDLTRKHLYHLSYYILKICL